MCIANIIHRMLLDLDRKSRLVESCTMRVYLLQNLFAASFAADWHFVAAV